MSHMPVASLAMIELTTVAMTVAMMLPSIAPSLWRYHQDLRAMGVSRAMQRAMLLAIGYISVWTTIGLVLSVLPVSRVSPWAAAIVLCAGAVQRSRWKAKRLLRCRETSVTGHVASRSLMTAWRDGCRLGVDCALSCAAPMAVLLLAGLMDVRMMVVITAAITAERVAPAGVRIARLTGGLALIAGLLMWVAG